MVVCRIALWALALVAAAGDSLAQKLPARPVRLIVAFASGGSLDFIARGVGQKLAAAWGQQVVVDNRPGAGGDVGAEVAANALPDGHTLYLCKGYPFSSTREGSVGRGSQLDKLSRMSV